MNMQEKLYKAITQMFDEDPRNGTVDHSLSQFPREIAVVDQTGNYCHIFIQPEDHTSSVNYFGELTSSFGNIRMYLTSDFFLWFDNHDYYLSRKSDPEYVFQIEAQGEQYVLYEAYKQIAEEMFHVIRTA